VNAAEELGRRGEKAMSAAMLDATSRKKD
jgi:hypothetical protein